LNLENDHPQQKLEGEKDTRRLSWVDRWVDRWVDLDHSNHARAPDEPVAVSLLLSTHHKDRQVYRLPSPRRH
jgi:hypothetical protein